MSAPSSLASAGMIDAPPDSMDNTPVSRLTRPPEYPASASPPKNPMPTITAADTNPGTR